MKKIVHTVDVNAEQEAVYDAVTQQGGLSNWWTTNVSIDGNQIHFGFDESFQPIMEVKDQEDGRMVEWECVAGNEVWVGSQFSFTLSENEGKARLVFIHEYAIDLPEEVFGMFNYNWGYYLDSLRLYCEEGKGKPFPADN